ncbi:MAG: hypothetical protein ACK5NT_11905 [Pyrinomonadaceae bacterium]
MDDTQNNISSKNVKLKSNAKVEDGVLTVDYEIKNESGVTIYLLDEMIAYRDSKPVIDRDTSYVFLEEPRTLRIVRATLRQPKGKRIYSLEIPYARQLQPGEKLNGTVKLKAPIKEKSPFYPFPEKENGESVDCNELHLIIGWTTPIEGTKIMEVNIGGEKVFRIRGRWYQQLAESEERIETKLIRHTDDFDRQMPLGAKEQ